MYLRIAYLYPEIMNIYGDQGNIIALKRRCQWRGIKTSLTYISLNENLDPGKYDLFFAGGGQDRQQLLVAKDLQKKKAAISEAAEAGKVFLLVCGSYQLFGHYFKTHENKKIPGIGILDMTTIASNKRKIGNVLVKTETGYLVGFENHSGNTLINQGSFTKALGTVVRGFGNNGKDKTEGAVYKNVYGTYLHGSLLPKNPHFADFLIKKALENRYQKPIKLEALEDSLEWQAHNYVKKMVK